jgi:hypothetical protein
VMHAAPLLQVLESDVACNDLAMVQATRPGAACGAGPCAMRLRMLTPPPSSARPPPPPPPPWRAWP